MHFPITFLLHIQHGGMTRRAAPHGVACAQGALKLCQQALVKYPDHELLKVLRAIGLDRSGKKEEALQVVGVWGAVRSLLGCRGCARRTGARAEGCSAPPCRAYARTRSHTVASLALPFALQPFASSTLTNDNQLLLYARWWRNCWPAVLPPRTTRYAGLVSTPMGSAPGGCVFVCSTLLLTRTVLARRWMHWRPCGRLPAKGLKARGCTLRPGAPPGSHGPARRGAAVRHNGGL